MSNNEDIVELNLIEMFPNVVNGLALKAIEQNQKNFQLVKSHFDKTLPSYISSAELSGNEFNLNYRAPDKLLAAAIVDQGSLTLSVSKASLVEQFKIGLDMDTPNMGPSVSFKFPDIDSAGDALPKVFNDHAGLYRTMSAQRVLANTLNRILDVTRLIPVHYGSDDYSSLSVELNVLMRMREKGALGDLAECCGDVLNDYEGLLAAHRKPSGLATLFSSEAQLHAKNVTQQLIEPTIKKYGFDI